MQQVVSQRQVNSGPRAVNSVPCMAPEWSEQEPPGAGRSCQEAASWVLKPRSQDPATRQQNLHLSSTSRPSGGKQGDKTTQHDKREDARAKLALQKVDRHQNMFKNKFQKFGSIPPFILSTKTTALKCLAHFHVFIIENVDFQIRQHCLLQ